MVTDTFVHVTVASASLFAQQYFPDAAIHTQIMEVFVVLPSSHRFAFQTSRTHQ